MRGPLDTDQQLAVLTRVWGNDREGYVFLPWIAGRCKNKDERKKAYHEGPAFEWPVDKDKIAAHLAAHADDDVYFTPCLFEDKRRIEECAVVERSLWADLDEVDPRSIDEGERPTIAWESSPGRYQGVWLLDRPKTGLSWPGGINHRLTKHLGADPSGWDTTQLLRVPGRKNFKPDYKDTNAGQPVDGSLLWDNGPRFTIDDFNGLPEIPVVEIADSDLMDEEVIKGVDRRAVWGRVRLKVSMRVREYMGFRSPSQISADMDRSEIQWQIMCDLADAGCTVTEIVAVIRPTVWNSYAGRRDELKRLKIGAAKAVAKSGVTEDGDDGALEVIDEDKPDIRWLNDVMAIRLRRPRWLINGVWSQGGCGFIAGDPKSYKSWFAMDMAVSVATGTDFLNDPSFSVVGGPRPMLYLQEEDSEVVVRDRFDNVVSGKCPHLHWDGYIQRVGNDVLWCPPDGRIPIGFHVRTGFIASDPGWQVWLADMVAEHRFGGVIVDTLGTTAGDVDTDRAQDLMSKILRPLREISHQTDCSIVVVHHNRKNSNGDTRGGQRMLGSVALHAWVDDALYVHTREAMDNGRTKVRVERESKAATEHRWVVEVPRMGIGPDGTRTMWEPITGLWDASEGGQTANRDHTATPPKGYRGMQAGQRIARIVKLLQGNEQRPLSVDRVAGSAAISQASCRKQLQSAIEAGFIEGTVETGVW
jgi:hypothetical protein